MSKLSLYFIGAGGIGMSALVRYFLAKGHKVAGYDKTPTELTQTLIEEGAEIHFEESVDLIPEYCLDKDNTLVVRTPAVPTTHKALMFFLENGFRVIKRAEILGEITKMSRALCVAGTHGKTTTSTMLAHFLKASHVDCNAFLGGILKNYSSNLMLSDSSDLTVIEADEYDRSFHHLEPYMAIVTSSDPDHLDIYGTEEEYLNSFKKFTSLVREGGTLLLKKGITLIPEIKNNVNLQYYAVEESADYIANNVRISNGTILFDFIHPKGTINDVELGVPIWINIENCVAAMAIALLNGVTPEELKCATKSYSGAKRRFDFHIKKDTIVLLDDYAHHPEEVEASIKSIKQLYPNRKVSVIFQPHLYSRTNDFFKEFAHSLSKADEVILLDIYPARELPIQGVTSKLIYDLLSVKEKSLISKNDLLEHLKLHKYDVLVTLGAGDIDTLLPEIKNLLQR
ncbi:MAG: UDP-N-acetylmuramate--L-alanine ligase [Bacteroidales bacterium]